MALPAAVPDDCGALQATEGAWWHLQVDYASCNLFWLRRQCPPSVESIVGHNYEKTVYEKGILNVSNDFWLIIRD